MPRLKSKDGRIMPKKTPNISKRFFRSYSLPFHKTHPESQARRLNSMFINILNGVLK